MKGRRFANKTSAISDERWLYGVHPVTALLQARPLCVRWVAHLEGGHQSPRVREALHLAEKAGIRSESVAARLLEELTGTHRHQGLAARCDPFPYASFDDIIALQTPLVLVIDQLQDPQNLGAILRSCDAAGARAVILPKDGTVGITPLVEAAAAGAAAFVQVCRVTNLVRSIELLKQRDYWVAGLAVGAAGNLFETEMPGRIALVLGGESGLRRLVLESCDLRFSIPMYGAVESLNASVAAAITLFELRRRLEQASRSGQQPAKSASRQPW